MLSLIEDSRTEFKFKLTDKFEKEVIAFLNTNGGDIYIGVDDSGNVAGIRKNIDNVLLEIKDRIKNNVMPSTLGLFDTAAKELDGLKYIQITIARGSERPYYLKGLGMSPDSCFIRVSNATESMTTEMINNEFSKRTKNSLKIIASPKQELTFSQLKIYYEEKGFKIEENFLQQLDLFTDEGKYNYVAYLLSDNNTISLQFAKYDGDDTFHLIENQDFGFCSILKATKNILNKFELENITYTKITYPERKQIKLYDYEAIREAIINAVVHNDWSNEYSPKFEIFSNKLEISSHGGIAEGISKKDFLAGISAPKNKELMRVFKDLDLVEHLGTGIRRILKTYEKSIYHFYPNFIRMSVPFRENEFAKIELDSSQTINLTETQKSILKLIQDRPNITQAELARLLGVAKRTIIRNMKNLIGDSYLIRVGSDKTGYWQINKK